MDTVIHDLRCALRAFRREPGFALAAILTLALGIGATTSIFSVVNGVLLKSLPYPEPSRLVSFQNHVSALNLRDVLAWSRSFAAGGGCVPQPLAWTDGLEPVQLEVGLVTGGLFEAMGVPPARGRTLTAADDHVGGERIVVVSHGFWMGSLGGDANVLGRTLRLAGESYRVVGVMPAGFSIPRIESEVFAPLEAVFPPAAQFRGINFLRTSLRLAPGVTLGQARQEMVAIGQRLEQVDPQENTGRNWELSPLRDRIVGNVRTALWILLGAVGLVLLVACSNFASLLLTRSTSRVHDLSVRSALGAGRPQLMRLLVTESVLLALIGGGLGVLFSQWAVDLLLLLSPANLPRLGDIAVDGRVLAFALALSVSTGIVFGLMPAYRAAQGAEAEALKRSGATVAHAAGGQRLLGGLVTAQIALALVLLAGAGLLVNGFWRLRSVPPGFDPRGTLTLRIELPEAKYPDLAAQSRYRDQVFEALSDLPGARVAMISELPLTGDALMHNVLVDGAPPVPRGTEPELFSRSVQGNYFEIMRIPIVAGRALAATDRADAMRVGVINESMAREYFPRRSPIGQRVRWASQEVPEWITIVGVAADVRHFGLREREQPAIYTPYAQFGADWKRWMHVVVRGERGIAGLVAPVKARIASVDREIPLTRVQGMEEILGASLAGERFNLVVITIFAMVALALAVLGVFGVTAYAVGRRTREFGLRMALGATGADLWRLVLGRGAVLVGIGLGVGVAGALLLTRLMTSLLYEVQPNDPVTFAVVALVLGVASLAACAMPALRATRMEPLSALRVE